MAGGAVSRCSSLSVRDILFRLVCCYSAVALNTMLLIANAAAWWQGSCVVAYNLKLARWPILLPLTCLVRWSLLAGCGCPVMFL